MKKRMAAMVLAAVMAMSFTVTAFAGTWQIYDDNWYFYDSPEDDGEEELLTGWQWIEGYCYYLDPEEDGAMAVSTVTPDGFSVNEIGRMIDIYGEPYYIPGWGLTSTTLGPGEYEPGSGVIYGEPSDSYLSHIFDLESLYDILRGRDRERERDEEARRRNPDMIVVVVGGGQPNRPEGEPDKAGELPEKPEEKPEEQPEKPEEQPKAEEQTDNPVIRAGGSTSHSGSASGQTERRQTERPAERQQEDQQASSGQATQGAGRTQGRPGSGSASRSRGGLEELDPELLALLGLE